MSKHDVDFLWNYLKDLNNQSCQITLKKFEKYYGLDFLPVKVYVQNMNNFTSLKVNKENTIEEIIKENFPNVYDNENLKPEFSSKDKFLSLIHI